MHIIAASGGNAKPTDESNTNAIISHIRDLFASKIRPNEDFPSMIYRIKKIDSSYK